jgi:hypothetical protein
MVAPYQTGSYDFHAYYRAFKAILAGLNPYDINNSKMLYFDLAQPVAGLAYFNPPWLLFILCPLFYMPFVYAVKVWIVLIIAFSIAISFIAGKLSGLKDKEILFLCIFSLTFTPVWDVIFWGNISILIPFGLIGFLLMIDLQRDWLTGPFLVLASLKPQIVFLVGILIAFWILINRKLVIIASYILTLLILIIISEIVRPGITLEWVSASQTGWNHLYSHASSNLSNALRNFFLIFGAAHANYFLIVIPLVTTVFGVLWLIKNRNKIVIQETIVPFIAFNLLCTSYSWFHDYSALLVSLCLLTSQILLSKTASNAKYRLLIYAVALNFFSLLIMTMDPRYFSHMAWFGIVFILWFFKCRDSLGFYSKEKG